MAESNATAAIRLKKVPIVIVPGLFGTRLSEPGTGKLVWNPAVSGHGAFAADDVRLKQVDRPLVPDEGNSFPVNHDNFLKLLPIKHHNNVLFDFYGNLVLAMHHDLRPKLAPKRVVPVVFCCGYDFRQDNAVSARRLSTIVDEAQAACNGEKAIIIAHSMGGLVSRHYCKNLGGEAKVRALFLIASPTHGAPKAYFILRKGDDDKAIRAVLFQRQDTNRRFSRVVPSGYQLLPTALYGKIDPNWLTFDGKQTGFLPDTPTQGGPQFTDASENFFVYRDLYTGLMDDPEFRDISSRHLATALQFDSGLLGADAKTYMHPTTFVISSGALATKGKLRVDFSGVVSTNGVTTVVSDVADVTTVDGDQTVPSISGNPQLVSPEPTRTEFGNLTHTDVPNVRITIDHVMTTIDGLF